MCAETVHSQSGLKGRHPRLGGLEAWWLEWILPKLPTGAFSHQWWHPNSDFRCLTSLRRAIEPSRACSVRTTFEFSPSCLCLECVEILVINISSCDMLHVTAPAVRKIELSNRYSSSASWSNKPDRNLQPSAKATPWPDMMEILQHPSHHGHLVGSGRT